MQTEKFTSALELQKQLTAYNDHLSDFDEVFGKELGLRTVTPTASKSKPPRKGPSILDDDEDEDYQPEDNGVKEALRKDFHMTQDMTIQRSVGDWSRNTFGLYSELAYGSDRREFLELYRYRLVRRIEALNLQFSKL